MTKQDAWLMNEWITPVGLMKVNEGLNSQLCSLWGFKVKVWGPSSLMSLNDSFQAYTFTWTGAEETAAQMFPDMLKRFYRPTSNVQFMFFFLHSNFPPSDHSRPLFVPEKDEFSHGSFCSHLPLQYLFELLRFHLIYFISKFSEELLMVEDMHEASPWRLYDAAS